MTLEWTKDRVVIPVAASNKEVATREGATSLEAGEVVVDAVAVAVDLEVVNKTTTKTKLLAMITTARDRPTSTVVVAHLAADMNNVEATNREVDPVLSRKSDTTTSTRALINQCSERPNQCSTTRLG